LRNEAIERDRTLHRCQMVERSARSEDHVPDRLSATINPDVAARHHALATVMVAIASWAAHCRNRAAERRALSQLDDRLLRDIGINRTDVAAECRKWFWIR
jgi:uncharacterized protein YjiS (DUF1127 family)